MGRADIRLEALSCLDGTLAWSLTRTGGNEKADGRLPGGVTVERRLFISVVRESSPALDRMLRHPQRTESLLPAR